MSLCISVFFYAVNSQNGDSFGLRVYLRISVPSSQFCCKPKPPLERESFLKRVHLSMCKYKYF